MEKLFGAHLDDRGGVIGDPGRKQSNGFAANQDLMFSNGRKVSRQQTVDMSDDMDTLRHI